AHGSAPVAASYLTERWRALCRSPSRTGGLLTLVIHPHNCGLDPAAAAAVDVALRTFAADPEISLRTAGDVAREFAAAEPPALDAEVSAWEPYLLRRHLVPPGT